MTDTMSIEPDDFISSATLLYTIRTKSSIIHPSGIDITVPRPDVLPQPGDILIFVNPNEGYGWEVGDEIHLMDRTEEAPHESLSELGNWQIINKKGVDVWANIEWLMAEGKLAYL